MRKNVPFQLLFELLNVISRTPFDLFLMHYFPTFPNVGLQRVIVGTPYPQSLEYSITAAVQGTAGQLGWGPLHISENYISLYCRTIAMDSFHIGKIEGFLLLCNLFTDNFRVWR